MTAILGPKFNYFYLWNMEDRAISEFSESHVASTWPSGDFWLKPQYAALQGLGHNVLLTTCGQHMNG